MENFELAFFGTFGVLLVATTIIQIFIAKVITK